MLKDILADLQDADCTLQELRGLAEEDAAARINAEAVARLRRDVVRRLELELRRSQADLMIITIAPADDAGYLVAASVSRSILAFQEIATAMFDAVRAGPRDQFTPSSDTVSLSAFEFAGADSGTGALQIALSIPNERLLAIESDLDAALSAVLDLLQAQTSDEIRQIAAAHGVAAVTKAYAWADNSIRSALDTTFTWRKSAERWRTINVRHSDALVLASVIATIMDERVDTIEQDYELINLDDLRGRFHLKGPSGERIEGALADGFPQGRSWTTRRLYRARLRRVVQVGYATGERSESWILERLSPE